MKRKLLGLVILILTSCTTEQSLSLSKNANGDLLWSKDAFNNEVLNSDIILNDEYSISLWYKGYSNKTGSKILTLGDDENYIELITSGYDGKYYSGLTLYDDNDNWVVSEGKDTLKSNRFNYVVINVKNDNAEIYLNGKLVQSGKISNDIKADNIIVGKDNQGFYSDLFVKNRVLNNKEITGGFNEKYPAVLLDTVNIVEADDLIHDYWVDGYEIEGYPVTWTSDNQEIIDYRGVIMKEVEEDTLVKLTADLKINGYTASKVFEVFVRSNTDERLLIRDSRTISNYLDRVMFNNSALPSVLTNGSSIEYEIMGNAYIENNRLIKSGAADKEIIKLKAIISKGEFKAEKEYEVILMDEIGGYIMAYFNGELEEETGYLAYSEDGLNWIKLHTAITTDLGSKRIRDPFISRDKNGNFMLVATEGFDNPNIYIFESDELLDFNRQNLVQLAYYDEGLRLTGERAWAPEFTYDLENDLYYFYYSDNGYTDDAGNVGGPIFAVTSKDLTEFSYPYMYFNPGYSVIDGTILKHNGFNYLFYKDERKAAQTVFYAKSDVLSGFNQAYDEKFLNLVKYMEGPFVFKNKNNGYFIYMDNYPNQTFYVGEFNEINDDLIINWLDNSMITLPEEVVRHGSVVKVTEKELKAIIEKYGIIDETK